jgi:aspartate/methionine/tyrosine aminotransferase
MEQKLKFSRLSERAYARAFTPLHHSVPVQALGEIYSDFGHSFEADGDAGADPREDVIELGIGRYFDCAPEIVNAAIAALQAGHTRYLELPTLKQAIADKYRDEQGVSLDTARDIVLLGGCRPGMALAMLAGLEQGDRVIVPDPDYIGILHMASAIGAEVVRAPMAQRADRSLVPDLNRMEDLAKDGLAAIFLTNPNNPTGHVWTRDELRGIAAIADRHGAFIMVNEVYDKLTYDGQFTSYVGIGDPERSLVVGGTSKSYDMTGFGFGWLTSSAINARRIEDLMFLTHQSKPDAPSQYAALAALTPPVRDAAPRRAVERLMHNAALTVEAVDGFQGCACPMPVAGQFAFPFIDGDDRELARFLLRHVGLQVVPGNIWGASGAGHLRIALANDAEHQARGLERLRRGISLFRDRA